MTTMNALSTPRARCAEHGFILDDSGRCSRCARQEDGKNARGLLQRVAMVGGAVVLLLVAYRVTSVVYDSVASRRVAATASASAQLVVYTTTSCGACRFAKGWMDQNGVAYEERSVDTDEGARKELTSLGKGMVVPTFVVGDEVLTGFDVQGIRLTEALKAHGLR